MKLSTTMALAGLLVLIALAPSARAEDLEATLRFEVEHDEETPQGWGGGPTGTIRLDDEIVHEGQWAARLTRDAQSARSFSTITKAIPVDFSGGIISLVGFLRTEDVTEWVGLWMREDGAAGAVAFDNMQRREVNGTNDWTEYRIDLPLQDAAKEVYFGALIAGEGTLWVDDLRILVDDKPLSEAPERVIEPTVLDADHEFDKASSIDLDTLSDLQVENLTRLGKVWGFLKYHHRRVTAGEFHWDYELFRVMPSVLDAVDATAAKATLAQWIDSLGEVQACAPCAEPAVDPHLTPDLDWISDRAWLGEDLSQRLERVRRDRHVQDAQFYAGLVPNVQNAIFRHELPYRSARLDTGYRILGLFRFWNAIEYWFPYRDVIGEDWDAVLTEFLPRLAEATESHAYSSEMLQLIARVHDTHANLWSSLEVRPPWGDCRLPVRMRFVGDRAVVVSLKVEADSTALRVGDVLEVLDGRRVEDLVDEWGPFYAASNEATRLRDMARELPRGDCGPCTARVRREGEGIDLSVERRSGLFSRPGDQWNQRPGETFQMLGDDVAYLKLSPIELDKCADYIRQAEGTKGLVIDIRNYPTNFVVFALGQHLVAEETPFARFTRGDLSNPGAFTWSDPMSLTPAAPHYEGKVVVLVDEGSQSQAEYTSMALRSAPGAIVVGSTTAGADGNVSTLPLPGSLSTMISGIGVFYPDKTPTQRVGIVPDVEALPSVEGIRAGRDEVLEEALRQILGDVSEEELRERTRLSSN